MDAIDTRILNRLQDGLPIVERPYLDVADEIGLSENELLRRLRTLLDEGVLNRFGPLFDAERIGGKLLLVAMAIPYWDFDRVTSWINALPEVAHNYEREHTLNLWFVLATETPEEITPLLERIESNTGYSVYAMPKLEQFYVRLKFSV